MDGQAQEGNDEYQTADEYAFVTTTVRSFQEVEEIAAGEYWPDNTSSDNEYDTNHEPGDAPGWLYLPDP